VFEDAFDNSRFIDQRHDAHDRAAVRALKRINCIHFVNQPDPVGLAPPVRRSVIEGGLRLLFTLQFCPPARTARAVGVIAVIADQVLVLIGNMVEQQAQPFQ